MWLLLVSAFPEFLRSNLVLAHPGDRASRGFHLDAIDVGPALAATLVFGAIGLGFYFFLNRKSRRNQWLVAPDEQAVLNRAYSLMWAAFYFTLVAFTVGLTWDSSFHTRQPFEDFYSAPHLFIYTMTGVSILLALLLASRASKWRWFGPVLPFPGIPGSLLIMVGGAGTILLSGFFDLIWHSNFGLDETSLSLPHSMLGWGLLITILGALSSILALRSYRPPTTLVIAVLGALIIAASAAPVMGPYYQNETPAKVKRISEIPVLKESPEAQHTFRIYLERNISRTNPVFILLAALWVGVVLAFLRRLIPRARLLFGIVALLDFLMLLGGRGAARAFGLLDDPASWLPLPLFPALLIIIALPRLGVPERWSWGIAGLVNGLVIATIWTRSPAGLVFVILGVPVMLLGVVIGRRLYGVIEQPTQRGVWTFLIAGGIGVPLFRGIVDLIFRATVA
ncbi:MAG: hypothetical protein IIC84_00750 [Chloroflexi bacterium]|nr:hypothetical protein [Chloroflexota bacterium]